MILAVIFFFIIALVIVFAVVSPVVRAAKVARDGLESKASYFLAEAGVEDAVYRTKSSMQISNTEVLTLDGHVATTTIDDVSIDERRILADADVDERIRRAESVLKIDLDSASFNFGVQVGNGGFELLNSSSIDGNVYANGPIYGANTNVIRGDAVSAGPSGFSEGIHATGTVRANTIERTDAENCYYQVIDGASNCTNKFPGSPDQPTTTFPISDSKIEEWKQEAAAGGVINSPCPYRLTSGTTSLGPVKIECDLEIVNDAVVNITGWIWVQGDVETGNTAVVQLDPSLDNLSRGIIADMPSDRINSSRIDLNNSTQFNNTGTDGTYVFMISQNEKAEQGYTGNDAWAIRLTNTAGGEVLLYSNHGEVRINNSAHLRQITAYRVTLTNTANVTYDSGLASTIFSSGPAGGWRIESWKEVK